MILPIQIPILFVQLFPLPAIAFSFETYQSKIFFDVVAFQEEGRNDDEEGEEEEKVVEEENRSFPWEKSFDNFVLNKITKLEDSHNIVRSLLKQFKSSCLILPFQNFLNNKGEIRTFILSYLINYQSSLYYKNTRFHQKNLILMAKKQYCEKKE